MTCKNPVEEGCFARFGSFKDWLSVTGIQGQAILMPQEWDYQICLLQELAGHSSSEGTKYPAEACRLLLGLPPLWIGLFPGVTKTPACWAFSKTASYVESSPSPSGSTPWLSSDICSSGSQQSISTLLSIPGQSRLLMYRRQLGGIREVKVTKLRTESDFHRGIPLIFLFLRNNPAITRLWTIERMTALNLNATRYWRTSLFWKSSGQ